MKLEEDKGSGKHWLTFTYGKIIPISVKYFPVYKCDALGMYITIMNKINWLKQL